ncbi:reverse transcriptase domain-containing protein [Tanacetum coccineum]
MTHATTTRSELNYKPTSNPLVNNKDSNDAQKNAGEDDRKSQGIRRTKKGGGILCPTYHVSWALRAHNAQVIAKFMRISLQQGKKFEEILLRCEETKLVLNWAKCHFMVKEEIVLGHKISNAGIEVDKAKVDVIAKLPYPTNVKGAVFGVPKALISDRGTHFCNSLLEKTLKKHGVTHRLATAYHPQTSGQTKNTNRAIKRILERTVNENKKEWADKLDDSLWALRTAYKSPIESTPFRIVYRKDCHLLIEMEHKAYRALKNVNLDLDDARRNRFLQLNKPAEMRNEAYEHSRTYKERTKRWHNARITDKEFQEGEQVLVFNSRLKLFLGKLKKRWFRPYTVSKVFAYGIVEVCGKDGIRFKVNGHRLKKYYGAGIETMKETLYFTKM